MNQSYPAAGLSSVSLARFDDPVRDADLRGLRMRSPSGNHRSPTRFRRVPREQKRSPPPPTARRKPRGEVCSFCAFPSAIPRSPLVTIHRRPRPDRDSTNNHRNLNRSSVSQDAQRNTRSGALEFDIDHCVVQPKLTQYNSIEGRGESWIAEADRSCGRIEFDPERGLNDQEKSTAGPCLGRTGHRIERGSAPRRLRKPQNNSGNRRNSI